MTKTHHGSCHCGAIRYEVDLDLGGKATRCNCSICQKLMWTGAMVKPDAFRLRAGEAEASGYVWGGRVSTRFFCKHCGTPCFGRGELEMLGGAFVSVNVNTLDDVDVGTLTIGYWDGRHDNWQAGTRPTPWPTGLTVRTSD